MAVSSLNDSGLNPAFSLENGRRLDASGRSAWSPDEGGSDSRSGTVAAAAPAIRPRLVDAPNRCPPPSPGKLALRIFVRADRLRIWPGGGTMMGESASSGMSGTASILSRALFGGLDDLA